MVWMDACMLLQHQRSGTASWKIEDAEVICKKSSSGVICEFVYETKKKKKLSKGFLLNVSV